MENPLEDAETLKIDDKGHINELGKKPTSYDEIEGQYIGLIKIKQSMLAKFKYYYRGLDKAKTYDGKDFENMFMTSFLQMIADNLSPLTPVFINNGWIEVDAPSDLDFYNFLDK
jgi:choline kinase